MANYRAWVFLTCVRTPGVPSIVEPTVLGIEELANLADNAIQKPFVVFGDYDIVVRIEAESLDQTFSFIESVKGVDGVDSATTMLAARMSPPKKESNVQHACVRIRTHPGTQEGVQRKLMGIAEVELADIVFGIYDIVAIVNAQQQSLSSAIKQIVRMIPEVTQTATLIQSVRK